MTTHPPIPQAMPDTPLILDPTLDAAAIARQVRTAMAHLARAFALVRGQPASEGRYEAQMQIYLARETLEGVLAWPDEKERQP